MSFEKVSKMFDNRKGERKVKKRDYHIHCDNHCDNHHDNHHDNHCDNCDNHCDNHCDSEEPTCNTYCHDKPYEQKCFDGRYKNLKVDHCLNTNELEVECDAKVWNDLCVGQNVKIEECLNVDVIKSNSSEEVVPVTVDDDLCVSGKLQIDNIESKTSENPVTVNDDLCVDGKIQIDNIESKTSENPVTVNDDLCINGVLQVRKVESKIENEAITVCDDVIVDGIITADSACIQQGKFECVESDKVTTCTLCVRKPLGSDCDGEGNLFVENNAKICENLSVLGDSATICNNLKVGGDTTLCGDVDIIGKLKLCDDAAFQIDDLNLCGELTVKGETKLCGPLYVNTIQSKPDNQNQQVEINDNLCVTGQVNIKNQLLYTNQLKQAIHYRIFNSTSSTQDYAPYIGDFANSSHSGWPGRYMPMQRIKFTDITISLDKEGHDHFTANPEHKIIIRLDKEVICGDGSVETVDIREYGFGMIDPMDTNAGSYVQLKLINSGYVIGDNEENLFGSTNLLAPSTYNDNVNPIQSFSDCRLCEADECFSLFVDFTNAPGLGGTEVIISVRFIAY